MKKLLMLALVLACAVSMNMEAGWRRRSKKQVTVTTHVAVNVPVRRVRTVRVVERVVPVTTVHVVEHEVPVHRVCCSRPSFNVGFGFGGPRAGFGFGFGF